MRAELTFFIFIIQSNDILSLRGKRVSINTNSQWFKKVQYQKATIYRIIMVLSFLQIYTFPWRGKTQLFTRQIKLQIGKSTVIILFIKRKMPTLEGNKYLSVHFFLHGPRIFHLSTENVRIQSVGNGHQSGYSHADTINNNINKTWKKFSIRRYY